MPIFIGCKVSLLCTKLDYPSKPQIVRKITFLTGKSEHQLTMHNKLQVAASSKYYVSTLYIFTLKKQSKGVLCIFICFARCFNLQTKLLRFLFLHVVTSWPACPARTDTQDCPAPCSNTLVIIFKGHGNSA